MAGVRRRVGRQAAAGGARPATLGSVQAAPRDCSAPPARPHLGEAALEGHPEAHGGELRRVEGGLEAGGWQWGRGCHGAAGDHCAAAGSAGALPQARSAILCVPGGARRLAHCAIAPGGRAVTGAPAVQLGAAKAARGLTALPVCSCCCRGLGIGGDEVGLQAQAKGLLLRALPAGCWSATLHATLNTSLRPPSRLPTLKYARRKLFRRLQGRQAASGSKARTQLCGAGLFGSPHAPSCC